MSRQSTPTTAQIRALRAESSDAGDVVRAFICSVALGDEQPADDADAFEERFGGGGLLDHEKRAVMAIGSREDAIRECARIITDSAK